MELTRRNFLQGLLVAGAGSAAVLAGCSPDAASDADAAEEPAAPTTDYASQVTDTMDADIVVVGAGMAGLSAAVEGLLGGANVLVLESQPMPGGNGNVTSVVMGVGTDMQKELGIEVTPAQIIATEMLTFNYGVDGSRWSTLVNNSKDNIEWLIEQGALFNGNVDNYLGMGVLDTGHWWVGDTGRDGATGYVTPMVARIEELGGQILTETAGREIILDDSGAVAGIYAETENGVLQVNAPAVILCTGGYANSDEILASRGFDPYKCEPYAAPGHNGDGINMALAAGAKSWLDNSSLMDYAMNPAIGVDSNCFSSMPSTLWVNGYGRRYVNENCAAEIPARAAMAIHAQDASYAVLDQKQYEAAIEAGKVAIFSADVPAVFEQAIADGTILQADTIADLASAAGFDAETFQETVDTYNAACKAGSDDEFGKEAEFMQALETAPFYLTDNSGTLFLTTIGGIDTTANAEVRSAEGGVIPGLFAAGVDGVELYRGLYTIDIPGSCNANNINSGRTAAQQALALI